MFTPYLHQMCEDMVNRGVTEAAIEIPRCLEVPVWNGLCESMELKLVSPYFIKHLPGRKSEVRATEWMAEYILKNLIRGDFVPERLYWICAS